MLRFGDGKGLRFGGGGVLGLGGRGGQVLKRNSGALLYSRGYVILKVSLDDAIDETVLRGKACMLSILIGLFCHRQVIYRSLFLKFMKAVRKISQKS